MIDDTRTIQIFVSLRSDEDATWGDSQNNGKSLTTVGVTLFLYESKHVFIILYISPKLIQILGMHLRLSLAVA